MRKLFSLTAALCTSFALSAAAERSAAPVVVELFTSQGCSSCPPADELLAQMTDHQDIIPLALHVDYWDYIGWKDRFAQPKFSKRQKGYARTGGWRQIYTPQMVINGAIDVVGSRPMKVSDAIQKQRGKISPVELKLRREGNVLHVWAKAHHQIRPCDIHLVRYQPQQKQAIAQGENAGRQITYTHIVQSWDRAAQWRGGQVFEGRFDVSGSEPIVVLIQEPKQGRIITAARLR